VPATSYANWFSYRIDFRSENWEIRRAIRMTRAVFSCHRLRFVTDAGLDDQKVFAWIAQVQGEFVIQASHLERIVEVANPRLQRWEAEPLQDLVQTVPFAATWQVAFAHAGTTRLAPVKVGWLSSGCQRGSRRSGRWWQKNMTWMVTLDGRWSY